MKSNADKYHLLVSTNNAVNIIVEKFNIKGSHCEELVGVNFDHKLTFSSHISGLCNKASKNAHALACTSPLFQSAR